MYCELKLEITSNKMLKDIVKNVDITILNKDKIPRTIPQIMEVSSHVLKTIGNTILDMSKDGKTVAIFGRLLNLHEGFDEEKEMERMFEELKAPKELHGLLKDFLNHIRGEHKNCADEGCKHG